MVESKIDVALAHKNLETERKPAWMTAFQLIQSPLTASEDSPFEIFSLSRIRRHSGIADVKLVDLAEASAVRSHWMTVILASGSEMRITFKALAMTRDVLVVRPELIQRHCPSARARFPIS